MRLVNGEAVLKRLAGLTGVTPRHGAEAAGRDLPNLSVKETGLLIFKVLA